ncbi:MAG TPA: type II toxin-antitoxin system VapC family toxin [Chthoniobacteraceae bacterium]|jgi:predicted nucleic acid-binding protein|nr:type II toxin-antitoxin system VapC family toxin [Chthoniobacteraceae bacterium]
MIYCDTSFLVSLYVNRDVRHPAAAKVASRFSESIPLVPLAELELVNSARRLCVARFLDEAELATLLSQLERDVRDGFLERRPLNQGAHSKTAMQISERRMAMASRSLDILHVAAAVVLEADSFASFDAKQRILAKAEGFRLLPANL